MCLVGITAEFWAAPGIVLSILQRLARGPLEGYTRAAQATTGLLDGLALPISPNDRRSNFRWPLASFVQPVRKEDLLKADHSTG